jgi:hypothetical protein
LIIIVCVTRATLFFKCQNAKFEFQFLKRMRVADAVAKRNDEDAMR